MTPPTLPAALLVVLILVVLHGAARGDSHLKRPDLPTTLAIASTTYFAASLIHEGLGHGVACATVGGHDILVATTFQSCDRTDVGVDGLRWIKASGTVANLVAGGLSLGALELTRPASGTTYYSLWLFSAVNLFKAGGYLMTDSLFGFGDWGRFNETFDNPAALRATEFVLGTGLYIGTIIVLRSRLDPLLGPDAGRKGRAAWLTALPYATGGLLVPLSASLSGHPTVIVTGALAVLGGTSALAWMWSTVRDDGGGAAFQRVERSWPWIATGIASLVGFTALGRGITF